MPANEIAERIAAAGWVRFELDANGDLQPNFRSQVSTLNTIVTCPPAATVDDFGLDTLPLLIVPLDRVFTRRETTVHAQVLQTLAEETRAVYPSWTTPFTFADTSPDTRILVCPLHLDWIGDYADPTWLPFGLSPGAAPVPDGFDLDLYNALAFMLPRDGADASFAEDFTFLVLNHPKTPEGTTATLTQTLTIPSAA